MLALDMSAPAYTIDEANIACVGAGSEGVQDWAAEQSSVCVWGVGQLGMAHRSDGPASSLRMFGHVHRAMCGGGCHFKVLEEHVCA